MKLIFPTVLALFATLLAACSPTATTKLEPASSTAERFEFSIERAPDPIPPAQAATDEPLEVWLYIQTPEDEDAGEGLQGRVGETRLADVLGSMMLGAVQDDPEQVTTVGELRKAIEGLPPGTKAHAVFERASGQGVGLQTDAAEALNTLNTSAPTSGTSTSGSTGGTTEWLSEVAAGKPSLLALVPLGVIVAAVGVGLMVWGVGGIRKMGVALVATGVTLAGLGFVADEHPWTLAVAGVLVLGVAGYAIWQGVRGSTATEATKAVTRAVQGLKTTDPEARETVKALVAQRPESTEAVRSLIEKLRE